MLQGVNKEEYSPEKIRAEVEVGIVPKGCTVSTVLDALRCTKKPNVLEVFGLLSLKKTSGGVTEDLGLCSVQLVTTAFTEYLVNAMQDSSTYPMDVFQYHGSGTGVTAEANTQTTLVTEVETRDTGTTEQGASANIYKSVATHTYGSTLAIIEHGLFSASSGGTMLDRSRLATAVNVEDDDEIEFTYLLTVNAE